MLNNATPITIFELRLGNYDTFLEGCENSEDAAEESLKSSRLFRKLSDAKKAAVDEVFSIHQAAAEDGVELDEAMKHELFRSFTAMTNDETVWELEASAIDITCRIYKHVL